MPKAETHQSVLAVVINCYNYAEYVGRAIDSVVQQANNDCELIVIDDGSIDRSWDVISGRAVKAHRLTNGGQRLACIYGLDGTTAPYVLFLDADDELKPGSIAKIISLLDPEISKLQFALTRVDGAGKEIPENRGVEAYRKRDELANRVLEDGVYRTPPTSGNVFRRDVCQLLREAHYDTAVDGIILFAAPFFGDVVSISEELGVYRVHGRNNSGLGQSMNPEIIKLDLHRFATRMTHLREVIGRLSKDSTLR